MLSVSLGVDPNYQMYPYYQGGGYYPGSYGVSGKYIYLLRGKFAFPLCFSPAPSSISLFPKNKNGKRQTQACNIYCNFFFS